MLKINEFPSYNIGITKACMCIKKNPRSKSYIFIFLLTKDTCDHADNSIFKLRRTSTSLAFSNPPYKTSTSSEHLKRVEIYKGVFLSFL